LAIRGGHGFVAILTEFRAQRRFIGGPSCALSTEQQKLLDISARHAKIASEVDFP
jgi:hypothetical protein